MINILNELPSSLLAIKPAVKQLFFQGDISLLKPFKVAIVGSRRPSLYTKNMTFALASAFKKAGCVVVSGAAMGVDAKAHEGAFPKTIAVMANSLDLTVPVVNKNLINVIANEALCLSEYKSTFYPTKYTFVQRNRIVVGLSDIVVLTEADMNSGTMRSANFALKSNKPIFVLPHQIGQSLGTQKLLQDKKAEAIYSIESFLENLKLKKIDIEKEDDLLTFCKTNPSYNKVVEKFKEKFFEYELLGKVKVLNGHVVVIV